MKELNILSSWLPHGREKAHSKESSIQFIDGRISRTNSCMRRRNVVYRNIGWHASLGCVVVFFTVSSPLQYVASKARNTATKRTYCWLHGYLHLFRVIQLRPLSHTGWCISFVRCINRKNGTKKCFLGLRQKCLSCNCNIMVKSGIFFHFFRVKGLNGSSITELVATQLMNLYYIQYVNIWNVMDELRVCLHLQKKIHQLYLSTLRLETCRRVEQSNKKYVTLSHQEFALVFKYKYCFSIMLFVCYLSIEVSITI